MHLFGLIFLSILIVCFIGIIIMLVSLTKQGDERRKMIVNKSCANTFLVMVAYTVICAVVNIFSTVKQGIDPFLMLSILSVVYFVQLLYNKKKYGD